MAEITDNRGYNQIYKDSKSMRYRTERRCDYINAKIERQEGARVLEIGCGTGKMSHMLASRTKNQILGVDLCQPFIEEAKQNYALPNLKYKVIDFNDKSTISTMSNSQKFNYIYGNGILHHLYHTLDTSLKNIANLLQDEGRIVFLEPNIVNPYCFLIFNFGIFRKLAKLEPSEMAFTKKFITGKLKTAGFIGIKVKYKDFLLPSVPDVMIRPSITAGGVLEKLPFIRMLAQSIYISAIKAPK